MINFRGVLKITKNFYVRKRFGNVTFQNERWALDLKYFPNSSPTVFLIAVKNIRKVRTNSEEIKTETEALQFIMLILKTTISQTFVYHNICILTLWRFNVLYQTKHDALNLKLFGSMFLR